MTETHNIVPLVNSLRNFRIDSMQLNEGLAKSHEFSFNSRPKQPIIVQVIASTVFQNLNHKLGPILHITKIFSRVMRHRLVSATHSRIV